MREVLQNGWMASTGSWNEVARNAGPAARRAAGRRVRGEFRPVKPAAVVLLRRDELAQILTFLEPDGLLAESRLSGADRSRVLDAFEKHGVARLAPVHEALEGAVDYDELHLLRLYLLSGQPQTSENRSACNPP